MHLLYLTEIFYPYCRGGAGRVAGDLIFELAIRGHRIDVVCPVPDAQITRHTPHENVQIIGLPVANLPAGKRIDAPYSPRMVKAVWRYLAQAIDFSKVDLFHDNGGFFRDLFPVEMELREATKGKPFVAQFQIQWRPLMEVERQDRSKIPPLLEQQRQLAAMADRVLFLSEDEEQEGREHLQVAPDKIVRMPNAIPLDRFAVFDRRKKPMNGVPVIALAGRLETRSKGLDLALEALECLAPDYDFEVRLIGHQLGPEAIPADLDGRVSGTGWLDGAGVAEALHGADIFIMPSRYEPFGLLALEAQAVGAPVIAMATGGLREIIVPGETGLLVSPDNAVNDIEAHTVRLLEKPEERQELAEAAFARLEEEYTIPHIADRMLDLYASLGASSS